MAKQSRVPLMAGNWKMNLNHQEAVVLVQKLAWTLADKKHDYAKVEVAVLPPFTDLRGVQTLVDGDRLEIRYGAQDVSSHDDGAFTGEISAGMLAKLGCTYVVVGHSERREHHAESDELVNAKARKALGAEMTPIVCVGEGLEVRRDDRHVEHTLEQVDGSLAGLSEEQVAGLVVAYEPVWAIGTGKNATPDDAAQVHELIRMALGRKGISARVPSLYGGSVNPENVASLLTRPQLDGVLVGGASLTPEGWAAVIDRGSKAKVRPSGGYDMVEG